MNVARLMVSAAILTTLAIDLAVAKPTTVAADVNLRKGPGTDSEVITLIPKGTVVEVGTCINGWCGVSWNGSDGYSIATNLSLGGPALVRRRPPPVGADEYDYPPPPGTYGPPPGYWSDRRSTMDRFMTVHTSIDPTLDSAGRAVGAIGIAGETLTPKRGLRAKSLSIES
jgi:uncharacterized protein YgiM (DUF1202 family)